MTISSKTKRFIRKSMADVLLLTVSFILFYLIKYKTLAVSAVYARLFAVLILCWVISLIVSRKFRDNGDGRMPYHKYITGFFVLTGFICIYSMVLTSVSFSRVVIFGTLGLFYFLEVVFLSGKYFTSLFRKNKKHLQQERSFIFLVFEFILFVVVFLLTCKLYDDILLFSDSTFLFAGVLYFAIAFFGMAVHKYDIADRTNKVVSLWPYIKSGVFVILSVSIFSVLLKMHAGTIRIVLVNVAVFYLIEILVVMLYLIGSSVDYSGRDARAVPVVDMGAGSEESGASHQIERIAPEKYAYTGSGKKSPGLKDALERNYLSGFPELFTSINDVVELETIDIKEAKIIRSADPYNVEVIVPDSMAFFMNLHEVNDFRRINEYLISVNSRVKHGGIFVGRFFPIESRHKAIYSKYPGSLAGIVYFFDFIWKRVFPKLPVLQKFYFVVTKGKNRVLSRAQGLGRLYFCGFEVLGVKQINDCIYYIARKIKEPCRDTNPSYGPLFKMKRYGKNEKIIYVYKFRTMHPYSEYLQDYILHMYGYGDNGKPADDFRVTHWGKVFRKLWLDELPQLLNVLKGDMNLVGVRPLSGRFLKEYPKDVLEMRFKYKPGCVPPYVALRKQAVEEYIESERVYLLEKEKHPYWTDVKYFFWALYNIGTNKIRSA